MFDIAITTCLSVWIFCIGIGIGIGIGKDNDHGFDKSIEINEMREKCDAIGKATAASSQQPQLQQPQYWNIDEKKEKNKKKEEDKQSVHRLEWCAIANKRRRKEKRRDREKQWIPQRNAFYWDDIRFSLDKSGRAAYKSDDQSKQQFVHCKIVPYTNRASSTSLISISRIIQWV